MQENLKRIREPLAWAVVVALAGDLVATAAQFVVLVEGESMADVTFWAAQGMLMSWAPFLLAAVAAVWVCQVAPASPRAVPLATTAAVVATVGVVAGIGVSGYTLAASETGLDYLPAVLMDLPGSLLALVLAVALWALARPVPETDGAAAELPAQPELAADDDRPAPVWSREEAAGTVWRTADEAATGAPGSWSIASPDEPEEPEPPKPSGRAW